MDDFINVNKKHPQVQIKIKDISDKYKRLPYNYQSEIGSDTLIQNVIHKELINLMSTIKVDIDIELKMKNSRFRYLENGLL